MTDGPCFLYRHFDEAGVLLYVGISNRPGYRSAQHEQRAEWWRDVARIDLERFDSRAAAVLAEHAAIWRERPKHNVARGRSPACVLPLDAPPGGWPAHISRRVYFINQNWAVTEHGIESLAVVRYEIPADRIGELRDGCDAYDWPLHLAEKTWVALHDFLEAFEFALRALPPIAFDPDRWSITKALSAVAAADAREHDAGDRSVRLRMVHDIVTAAGSGGPSKGVRDGE